MERKHRSELYTSGKKKKNNSLDYPSVIAIKTSQKVRLGERKKKETRMERERWKQNSCRLITNE
jgi:hypothetical protein